MSRTPGSLIVAKKCNMQGWPLGRNKVLQKLRLYWSFKDDLAVINDILKWNTIIPKELQKQTLEQLYGRPVGIEKWRLLVHESIYWINMNTDIANMVKIVPHVLMSPDAGMGSFGCSYAPSIH